MQTPVATTKGKHIGKEYVLFRVLLVASLPAAFLLSDQLKLLVSMWHHRFDFLARSIQDLIVTFQLSAEILRVAIFLSQFFWYSLTN